MSEPERLKFIYEGINFAVGQMLDNLPIDVHQDIVDRTSKIMLQDFQEEERKEWSGN